MKIQTWRHWLFFLTSIPSLFKAYSSKFNIAVLIVRGGGNTVKPILIALLRFESNTMISCRFPSAAVFLVKKRTRILFLQPVLYRKSHSFHKWLPLLKGDDTGCKSNSFIAIQKAEFFYHILTVISMSCQYLTRALNAVSDAVQSRASLRHRRACKGWEHWSLGRESVWKKPEAVSDGQQLCHRVSTVSSWAADGLWGSITPWMSQPGMATDPLSPVWLAGKQTGWFLPAWQSSPVLYIQLGHWQRSYRGLSGDTGMVFWPLAARGSVFYVAVHDMSVKPFTGAEQFQPFCFFQSFIWD